MSNSASHWAAPYVGRPWSPTFNCWALVREVFRTRWGVEMPAVGVGELQVSSNVAAIKHAAEVSGWHMVDDPRPADGDVVLGRDITGKRHVGVMIESKAGLRLLHNDGHMTAHGPVGSVVSQRLEDAIAGGFSELEFWRRT